MNNNPCVMCKAYVDPDAESFRLQYHPGGTKLNMDAVWHAACAPTIWVTAVVTKNAALIGDQRNPS